MNTEKLWAIFWAGIIAIVAVTIVGLVWINQYDTARREAAIVNLINNGATPIQARCAVYGFEVGNDGAKALICQASALGREDIVRR